MKKVDISKLSLIPETMLITVRARAIETGKADGIIHDPFAVSILDRIGEQDSEKTNISPQTQLGVCIRTEVMDNYVKEFLKISPGGTVVNIGCGLDARFKRLGSSKTQWVDIDLPESINVRQRFFEEKNNYKMIAKSALDFSWMMDIPKSKDILFLCEGVLMYFSPEDVRRLLSRMAETFPGAEFAFDTISPWMVKNSHRHPDVKKYNAPFLWGIRSLDDLKEISSKILPLSSERMMTMYRSRWPFWMKVISNFSFIKNSSKIVRVKFLG